MYFLTSVDVNNPLVNAFASSSWVIGFPVIAAVSEADSIF